MSLEAAIQPEHGNDEKNIADEQGGDHCS
jgi:hypothetical protein